MIPQTGKPETALWCISSLCTVGTAEHWIKIETATFLLVRSVSITICVMLMLTFVIFLSVVGIGKRTIETFAGLGMPSKDVEESTQL